MAVIRKLEQLTLDRDVPHTDVNATYSIVSGSDGVRYLQIDTYGSTSRQIPGKKSQSIRLGPEAIQQIKELLAKHFSA